MDMYFIIEITDSRTEYYISIRKYAIRIFALEIAHKKRRLSGAFPVLAAIFILFGSYLLQFLCCNDLAL